MGLIQYGVPPIEFYREAWQSAGHSLLTSALMLNIWCPCYDTIIEKTLPSILTVLYTHTCTLVYWYNTYNVCMYIYGVVLHVFGYRFCY